MRPTQYAAAAGTNWPSKINLSGTIPANGYFLIQMGNSGGDGAPLPAAHDQQSTGISAPQQSNGNFALVEGTVRLDCDASACASDPTVIDLVGYGTGQAYEGSGAAPATSKTAASHRNGEGCDDTDDNTADFSSAAPAPRNSASPANVCGGGGGNPSLSIADAQVAEGNSGNTPLNFTVTLSAAAPAGGVALTASTADGTAEAASDYVALVDAPFSIAEGQTSATVVVQIVGDTTPEEDETFTVTIATSTAGIDLGTATATGTIVNDDAANYEIHAIQGTGLRSPFAPASGNGIGELVSTQNNVVTAISENGFFIQTPDDRAASAPAEASTGVFVYTGSAPSVVVGDLVDVTGKVQEYYDWTQITGSPIIAVVGTGELPTPVELDETRPSPDAANLSCPGTQSNFECYENMLVHVAAGAAVTGNQSFGSDTYGEAFVTASGLRARREEGLLPSMSPPEPGLPVWDGNPEVFELDADGAGALPEESPIFGGDLFEAVGVIAFQFGNYALRPTSLTLVEADLPRPVPEAGNAEELRIGSLNALNLCAPACDRMDRIVEYIGDVLLLPDVIGLQEFGDVGEDLAAALNTAYATDYVTYEGVANTVPPATPSPTAIRNAFLVRPSRVTVSDVRNLDVALTLTDCSGASPCVLHDRPPQLLEGTFNGERFAVLNNHTRSMIGIDEGARVRAKRFAQAQSIAALVQRFQTGLALEGSEPAATDTAEVPLILVGDYNAFEVTDGLVDVVGLIAGTYDNAKNEYKLADDGAGGTVNITMPPLHNLVLDVDVEDRYSYTFAEDLGNILGESARDVGSVQVLDHGLVNEVAQAWCPELIYGRGNADAPAYLRNNGTEVFGSSDHDGLVIRLYTDSDGQCGPAPQEPHIFSDGFED